MAQSFDKALLKLLARLRAPRRGPASLLLLGWVLLAQTALVVHRIDHNAADHSTVCAACVAADQSADAGSTPIFVSLPQAPTPVATSVAESAGTPTLVPYRSRAPPERSLT
jgi:hypothetical protein